MELFKRSRIKAHHLLPTRITGMIHFCLIISRIWTPTTLFRNQKLEKEIKCKDNCLSLLILRGLSTVIWWTFLLFLLCNLKNERKAEYPEEILGSACCFYDGANWSAGLAVVFTPMKVWQSEQFWVPGTRTSLESHLKKEVHAWELKPLKPFLAVQQSPTLTQIMLQMFLRSETLKARAP